MTQERLQRRVNYLLSLYSGTKQYPRDETPDYAEGWFAASHIWSSGNTFQQSFRRVVDAKRGENDITDGWTEERIRGFDDALRVFQEAKGLSTESA